MTTETVDKTVTLNEEQRQRMESMFSVLSTSLIRSRSEIITKLFDSRRDIDQECGYAKNISWEQYSYLYEREGLAKRVVSLYPDECWAEDPEINEDEDSDETEWEKAWRDLNKSLNIFHFLHRVDELSGIGRFGVLFLGLSDGEEDLSVPAPGIDPKTGEVLGNEGLDLLYLRPFDEGSVDIKTRETDISSPRYSLPVLYSINFQDHEGENAGDTTTREVHWTRVIHVADNRRSSEVYGTPRMQVTYNRIVDVRKILSGSGEMFWKGAFPGYAFEINPDVGDAEIDATTLRETFEDYMNGLQRYLAVEGLVVKSLAPQVSDPKGHIETHARIVALTYGCPYRIFLGTEEAKLASSQDVKNWNRRVRRRQVKYLESLLLRPFINRLMAVGVLPRIEDYNVRWPDLNTPTEIDKAKVMEIVTKALSTYISSGVDQILPPAQFLTMIVGLDPDEVESVMKEAEAYAEESLEKEIEERKTKEEAFPPPEPPPGTPGNVPPGTSPNDPRNTPNDPRTE